MFRTVIARGFWVSGRFCLRILQGAGRPVSMLRHQDGGFSSRRRLAGTARPTGRSGESAASPRAATSAVSPVAVAGRPPYRSRGTRDPTRLAFFLHGGSLLPTRRIASPYTEGLSFLHGDLLGTLDCLSIVASVANIQFQSPIGHWQHWDWQHFHIGNIFPPHWGHL